MEKYGKEICTLGRGRNSKVYCMFNQLSNELIAVKAYNRNQCSGLSQNIIREKQILLRLQTNYSVVQLLDTEKDDNWLYFIFKPYLNGNLWQHIHHNFPFNSYNCLLYTVQLICGLIYVESKGVLHRDLKCSNLLLNSKGHIVISDFGSATQLYDSSEFAEVVKRLVSCKRCFTICGTIECMAPEMMLLYHNNKLKEEQLQKCESVSLEAIARLDKQFSSLGYSLPIDWYALGLILWEMHCGAMEHGGCARDTMLGLDEGVLGGESIGRLIKGLTAADETSRLGIHSLDALLQHDYFREAVGVYGKHVDWRRYIDPSCVGACTPEGGWTDPPNVPALDWLDIIELDARVGWGDVVSACTGGGSGAPEDQHELFCDY